MRTERILGRIETAFAEAVQDGEFEAAEGWVAVAAWVRRRSAARSSVAAGR
jgi:hypothetical protein